MLKLLKNSQTQNFISNETKDKPEFSALIQENSENLLITPSEEVENNLKVMENITSIYKTKKKGVTLLRIIKIPEGIQHSKMFNQSLKQDLTNETQSTMNLNNEILSACSLVQDFDKSAVEAAIRTTIKTAQKSFWAVLEKVADGLQQLFRACLFIVSGIWLIISVYVMFKILIIFYTRRNNWENHFSKISWKISNYYFFCRFSGLIKIRTKSSLFNHSFMLSDNLLYT